MSVLHKENHLEFCAGRLFDRSAASNAVPERLVYRDLSLKSVILHAYKPTYVHWVHRKYPRCIAPCAALPVTTITSLANKNEIAVTDLLFCIGHQSATDASVLVLGRDTEQLTVVRAQLYAWPVR